VKSIVQQILTNQEYIGKIKYQDKLYDGKHEAIIEESVFNLVQEQLKRSAHKQRFATKKKATEIPLGEFLYCGFCGHRLVAGYGTKEGKKHYYYKCVYACKIFLFLRTIEQEVIICYFFPCMQRANFIILANNLFLV